jgi:DNA-binding MarR family transcriptional regulator
MPRARSRRPPLGSVDYATLAELRYQIRRFVRMREEAARAVGLEPQQYLALLQVKGLDGRQPATISVLAERLQIRHHAAVQLVDRLVARGLARRRRLRGDRRHVVVGLTARGQALLRRLARYSLAELHTAGPALVTALLRLMRPGRRSAVTHSRTREVSS